MKSKKTFSKVKKTTLRIIVATLAILLALSMVVAGVARGQATQAMGKATKPTSGTLYQTSARAMATIEMTSGRILYSKNAQARVPMASTTKILTAISVIESVKDLDEVVKIHDKAIGVEGTSIYLQKGEKLTVRELLYGLMLRSGNDCSVALAYHVSGGVEDFAKLMNATAKKAGAVNSNFVNPHGLDEEGHLTTAMDLAKISAYAMRNNDFAKIVATKDITISGPEYKRPLQNKNRLLRSNSQVIGVKTGFTSKAGRCYVGAMQEDNMTVICVVLNCGPMFPESETLMTKALDEFYMHKVLATDTLIEPTKEEDGNRRGMVENDFYFPLRDGEIDCISIYTDGDGNVNVFFKENIVHTEKLKDFWTIAS